MLALLVAGFAAGMWWRSVLDRRGAAIIWTDCPEIAFYAGYFNAGQNGATVEVRYFESPVAELPARPGRERAEPDIVISRYLKNSSSRTFFRPATRLLSPNAIHEEDFYPRLLEQGRIDQKQYFLPVSFNLPAAVFARENAALLEDNFTTNIEEIRRLGKNFNVLQAGSGAWSRIGYSPLWNPDFSFITAVLFNANFHDTASRDLHGSASRDAASHDTGSRESGSREALLAWNGEALENSILYLRDWIRDSNTDIAMEDDFSFKYFFQPPERLVRSGRIFFAFFDSAGFFTLAEELRSTLDFRWIGGASAEGSPDALIPVAENSLWLGLCKQGKARKAAETFTRWLFSPATQRFLLEESRRLRLGENTFGIARGFSALRTVTETIFPQFYPSMLGHIPPAAALRPPEILPRNWMILKERVILPWLREQLRSTTPPSSRSLEQQIANFVRLNPE